MADCPVIEDYLSELGSVLVVPRRLRSRVLAEARDHLYLAAGRRRPECDPQDAEAEAIGDFGPPNVVARRFADDLALSAAHRATSLVLRVTAAFCLLVVIGTQVPGARAASPFAGNPYNSMAFLAAEIAFVCASLSWVRSLRHRDATALPAGKLNWILRGDATALAVIVGSVGADFVSAISAQPAGSSGWRDALLGGITTVGALTLVAGAPLIDACVRTRALVGLADEPSAPGDDALTDVSVLLGQFSAWARVRPGGTVLLNAVERLGRTSTSRRLLNQVDLRRHPWRACAALALGGGALVGLSHDFPDGLSGGLAQLPRALAADAIVGGVEGLAIVACFVLLAGFLGIRRTTPVNEWWVDS